MHPILLKIPVHLNLPLVGSVEYLTIYTYGVLVALAFLAGLVFVYFEAKRVGESPQEITNLVFYVIIAAIIGSRVVYVLVVEPASILKNPLVLIKVWEGGLVFYGGLIGAILVSLYYVWRHHLNYWKITDIFAPAIPLGHAFGRMGCFMAGCCHGRPSPDAWWSLKFPSGVGSFAPPDIPLYPTQLIEAGFNLLVFVGLFLFRKHKRFQGQVLAVYLIIYAILRSIIELYRGDAERGFVVDETLSTSQFISIIMVVFAAGIWIVNRKKFPVRKES